MSSHHIVREKQEPALLVLGLTQFDTELLGQLLEWSPTVIVESGLAEVVDSLGIKIDIVVGPTEIDADELQLDIRHITTGSDTVVDAALKYLICHDYRAVNIITDGFVLKDYQFYVGKIDMVIFCRVKKIYPITSGFSKWKSAGELIEVMGSQPLLQADGLDTINEASFLTTHDGFFTLQFNEPYIFIAESLN